MNRTDCPATIRVAQPVDAPAISALYERAYTPAGGGDARDHYPFPQLMQPDWIAEAVARHRICWVVADIAGQVLGSAGALRNIGSPHDRVAETFGVVVDKPVNCRGIGSALLVGLLRELDDEPQFILCESRTGIAAGWKVAKRCGFTPIGFEPFAHTTPAGSEAMVLTGKLAATLYRDRTCLSPVSPLALNLAEQVLPSFALEAPPMAQAPAHATRSQNYISLGRLRNKPTSVHPTGIDDLTADMEIKIERDDLHGPRVLDNCKSTGWHGAGVIGFHRFEGHDPQQRRYDRQFYVARAGAADLACLLIVVDRIDRRARMLQLESHREDLLEDLFAHVSDQLLQEANGKRLVLVVDVLSSALKLQTTLEKLGFVPSVWYPGLIASHSGREDALQYTKLFNCTFADSTHDVSKDEFNWEMARGIIERTQNLFQLAQKTR